VGRHSHFVSRIDIGRANLGLQINASATTKAGASFAIGTKKRSAFATILVSRAPA
jgi:hypothetical protein